MPNGSIGVKETLGGTPVATRPGYELDGDGAETKVQLVSPVSRQCVLKMNRGVSAFVSSADSHLTGSFPAEFTTNLIECGDKSTLIVAAEFDSRGCYVDITPFVVYRYDNAGTEEEVLRPLETKRTEDISTTAVAMTDSSDAENNVITPILAWDLLGAKKVGIHITDLSGDVKVAAGVI